MTTPARTDDTSPTTADADAGRAAPRRNGASGPRTNRPLVATRTAPRRPRPEADAAAPVAAPEPVAADVAASPEARADVEEQEALAARVARAASRPPRRTRTRAKAPEAAPPEAGAAEPVAPEAVAVEPEPAPLLEADADDIPALGTARSNSRRPVAVVIAAVVVAALVAALAYSVWHIRTVDAQNGRLAAQSKLGASALASATTYGGYLSSYNYKALNSANSAWTEVENNATASFKKDFTSTSGSLGKLLTQYNATATGKVVAAGVQSVSASRAVVLLFIDQTVTNTVQKPNSVTQPLRVQLTMLRQNGKWLIDNLQVPS